jgi:hypothetical protein
MAGRDAMSKSEYDAAYFTRLRAIEERDALLRYHEYLKAEGAALERFSDDLAGRAEQLDRKVRKPIDRTTKQLLEAVGRRRSAVLDELRRIDDRIAAAEDFVAECEAEVARLRR